MSALRFYWVLYRVALKSRTEYRVDFAVGIVTAALMQLAALSFYWVVFSHVPSLGGWPKERVLFLFGMTAMVLGLSELLLNGIWWLPWYVLGGELDRLLVYPVNTLSFLLLARPELHSFGNFFSGAAMVWISWHAAPPPLLAYGLVPLWVAAGTVIYTSVLVMAGCLSFGIVGPWSFHYMIVHHLLNASRYPATIYPRWLQFVLLFVFPMATATFLPGSWLEGGGRLWPAIAGPCVAAAASAAAAFFLWGLSVRKYQSTGS